MCCVHTLVICLKCVFGLITETAGLEGIGRYSRPFVEHVNTHKHVLIQPQPHPPTMIIFATASV